MSHKIAKAARRAVRAMGLDPRQVELKSGAATTKNINWATFSHGQRVLQASGGRAVYQRQAKQAVRRGLIVAPKAA
jgi:hypothetical protein